MKSFSARIRLPHLNLCFFASFIVMLGVLTLQAQDQSIAGNLTVNGEVDVYGNMFNLGSWSNDTTKLGLSTTYLEDANHAATLTLMLSRPVSNWLWKQAPTTGGGSVRQMLLDSNNALTLYDKSTPAIGKIFLDPLSRSVFQTPVTFTGADNQMPLQQNNGPSSVLTVALADARYPVISVGGNLSLGTGSVANSSWALAAGYQAQATAISTTAIGNLAIANKVNSSAFGVSSSATGNNSTALGAYETASGDSSVAVGVLTVASADNTLAIGYGSHATAVGATAVGVASIASGSYSTAFSVSTVASGEGSQAFGGGSHATGDGSTTLSPQANASGYNAMALGFGSLSSGYWSITLGTASGASGMYATALGDHSSAGGQYAVALGNWSNASGDYSTALTSSSIASGDYSTAGGNTMASGYYQFAIGRNSVANGVPHSWVPTDDLFTVGNGTSSNASNAFSVKKNGDTTVSGNLRVVKALIVPPQGDLQMGEFTAQPSPSPTP